jgi:hypothetical protein
METPLVIHDDVDGAPHLRNRNMHLKLKVNGGYVHSNNAETRPTSGGLRLNGATYVNI